MITWDSFEYKVRLQLAKNLVVTKVWVLGQVKDSLARYFLIIIIVENLDYTLSDKEHLLDVTFVADDRLVLLEDTTEHINDKFICETTLTLIKEMIERSFKLLEYPGILNKIRLHLRCDLLVEVEFLDDQVEIVEECLLNIFTNVIIECRLNVEWFVWFLNLLNPHVEWIQLLLNEIIKIIGSAEDTCDGTHQEWEERKT